MLIAHIDRSRRRIASAGLFDVALADIALAELAAIRDELDAVPPTPFLHDTTTRNVIVTAAGEVSGIVDVDDLCFGDPRYPAALTLAVLTGYGGPVQYVCAWMRRAALPDDRLFRMYVALFLLDLMSEHGQAFNGNERPSSSRARAKLQSAFDRSLGSSSVTDRCLEQLAGREVQGPRRPATASAAKYCRQRIQQSAPGLVRFLGRP